MSRQLGEEEVKKQQEKLRVEATNEEATVKIKEDKEEKQQLLNEVSED